MSSSSTPSTTPRGDSNPPGALTAGLRAGPVHFFTVDVEEHFQVSAFDHVLPRSAWDAEPTRVVANTERLLELLDRHRALGTFFVLGWVAERYPALVRRIAELGHEVASHGYWHYRVNRSEPSVVRDELRRSKRVLEDLIGAPVLGFRAPSFSITPGTEWAFDLLLEEGYRYDSSIFPIRRPGYGWPDAPLVPYRIERPAGTLLELPMTVLPIGGWRIPAAGGGYLRQLPAGLITAAFRRADRLGQPAVFYIHPWEVDPDQPRLPVGALTRIRHYRGLARTMPRLERLLELFAFTSIQRWLGREAG